MVRADHRNVPELLSSRLPGVEVEDLCLYTGYVAERDQQLAAAVLLHDYVPLKQRTRGKHLFLHTLAAIQSRQGLGTSLLSYAHDRLRRSGTRSVLASLYGTDGPVHDWWRRMGYTVDRVIGVDYGGPQPWWAVAAPGQAHALLVLDASLRLLEAPPDVREYASEASEQVWGDWSEP